MHYSNNKWKKSLYTFFLYQYVNIYKQAKSISIMKKDVKVWRMHIFFNKLNVIAHSFALNKKKLMWMINYVNKSYLQCFF